MSEFLFRSHKFLTGQVLRPGSGQAPTPKSLMWGQAALSFIILVSGIIIEIAIAGSFVTYFLSASGLGERLSYRALSVAETGIRDAQVKIVRDKDFVSAGSYVYSLAVGSDIASVEISRAGSEVYTYTIDSTGVASTRERKLVATMIVHATSGLAQLQSITETPL